jgi:hypothetical protein
MSERTLVRLRDRYPGTSRMTLYRLRRDPAFPRAVLFNGTEYYYTDELESYEASHRRAKPAAAARHHVKETPASQSE